MQVDFFVLIKWIRVDPVGHYSWRNHIRGSWFIQAVCKVFSRYHEDLDVLNMITLVNQEVMNCMPCTVILVKWQETAIKFIPRYLRLQWNMNQIALMTCLNMERSKSPTSRIPCCVKYISLQKRSWSFQGMIPGYKESLTSIRSNWKCWARSLSLNLSLFALKCDLHWLPKHDTLITDDDMFLVQINFSFKGVCVRKHQNWIYFLALLNVPTSLYVSYN